VHYLAIVAVEAAVTGRPIRAARLAGAADALRRDLGCELDGVYAALLDAGISEARDSAGSDVFADAWSDGATMEFDDAVAYALANED
jgi:hypothetical protein